MLKSLDVMLGDRGKTFFTLFAVIAVAAVLALIGASIPYALGYPSRLSFFAPWVIISGILLVAGYHNNGPLDQSVGGFLNGFTDWRIPTGISWWLPPPLGQSLNKTFIGKRELDRTKTNGKQLTQVPLRDKSEVEISYYALWRVVDLRLAALVEDIDQAFGALMDRSVRWYASYWDPDDPDSPDGSDENPNAISHRKIEFSDYLKGRPATDRNGNVILSGVEEAARKIGVEIDDVKVDDINLPRPVVEAREAAAAEHGQATKEKRDIASVRNRVYELKDGFEGDTRGSLNISDEHALHVVRTAKGDVEEIRVSGEGGDFTKGAAVSRKPRKRT